MSKTMIDIYKEEVADDYGTWSTTGKGKDKIKKTGANGTITAVDEAENRAMYDLYVQEVNAQNALNKQKQYLESSQAAALEANAKNKANAMRENAIMTERAREYAERRAIMNGTASAGVSQTAMIDLYSQMAGARADAQASYDNQERSIVQDYQDALLKAQGTYDTTMAGAQSVASAAATNAAIQRAGKAETARENKVTDVENALADYDAGNITFEELKKVYEDSQNVLDENFDSGIISEYQAILERQREEESFFGKDTGSNGATGVSTDGKSEGSLASDLKVTEQSRYINNGQISLESINSLLDVDGAGDGDEQDAWVNEVVTKIKNGQIKDGTIIDMNYGSIAGRNKGNYFVYKNGKLYQSDWTYDDVNMLLGYDEASWVNYGKKPPATEDGEKSFKVNGKEVTFLRKDD